MAELVRLLTDSRFQIPDLRFKIQKLARLLAELVRPPSVLVRFLTDFSPEGAE